MMSSRKAVGSSQFQPTPRPILKSIRPALGPFAIALGVSICLSRQMIGAHWTSDTMTGWAIGVAFAFLLAHQFARRQLVFR